MNYTASYDPDIAKGPPRPPFFDAMQALDEEIEGLYKGIEEFERRFEPMLNVATPMPNRPTAEQQRAGSSAPFVSEILSRQQRIRALNQRMGSIIERIGF